MIMTWWSTTNPEHALGFLPEMLSRDDPRPAREQFNEAYVSGWQPFEGFKYSAAGHRLSYPGDPPMQPIAGTQLRDEVILIYPYAWVLILQKDGSFECARLD